MSLSGYSILSGKEICTNAEVQFAIDNGIIDIEQVRQHIEMRKREELLEKHKKKYKIWRGKDGNYRTYVYDPTKVNKRKMIKKKREEDLEDAIIRAMKESSITSIKDVYDDFLLRKIQNDNIKKSTEVKYNSLFKKHFDKTGWADKDIRRISVGQLIDFCEDEIGKGLDSKATSNFRGLVKGIIKRAKNKGLVTYTYSDVLDCIEAKPKKKKKDLSKERFSKEEVHAFIKYVEENPTVTHLALLFLLVSGIRVGELIALTYDDFINDTTFRIGKTETIYKDDDCWVYDIGDSPKTDAGDRITSIPTQFAWIVKEMKRQRPFATFLCTNEKGERMTSQALRSRLYRVCDELGIERKSCHKLRKTFASILIAEGCNTELIKEIMGHTDFTTTSRFYNFDRNTESEKQEALDNLLEFKAV